MKRKMKRQPARKEPNSQNNFGTFPTHTKKEKKTRKEPSSQHDLCRTGRVQVALV
jgi:hypothetical protein